MKGTSGVYSWMEGALDGDIIECEYYEHEHYYCTDQTFKRRLIKEVKEVTPSGAVVTVSVRCTSDPGFESRHCYNKKAAITIYFHTL